MAQSATEKTNGNGSSGSRAEYNDLAKEIETLRADLSRLTETIGAIGRTEKDRLVASAKAHGEDLRAAGEAQYARAVETADGYVREGQRYVREQPGAAVGMAAAMGFLIGYVMTSRR